MQAIKMKLLLTRLSTMERYEVKFIIYEGELLI